jgi:polyferredoxin
MKKTSWNKIFLEFIVFFIWFIIVTILGKEYLPPSYYENGRPKLITIVILSVCLGLLVYLTTFFVKF